MYHFMTTSTIANHILCRELRACCESYVASLQVNGRIPRETLKHDPPHGSTNPGFTGVGQHCIILAQLAKTIQLAEDAFYDPPLGQDNETLHLIAAVDDFH